MARLGGIYLLWVVRWDLTNIVVSALYKVDLIPHVYQSYVLYSALVPKELFDLLHVLITLTSLFVFLALDAIDSLILAS